MNGFIGKCTGHIEKKFHRKSDTAIAGPDRRNSAIVRSLHTGRSSSIGHAAQALSTELFSNEMMAIFDASWSITAEKGTIRSQFDKPTRDFERRK